MIVQQTKELLRDVASGGGYLLGSSNLIPYYVRLENYRAMLDTLCEFGAYPVAV